MQTLDIFPTQLGLTSVVISEQEKTHILEYEKTSVKNTYGNLITNNKFILNDPIFSNLNLQITEHLKYYVDEILGYDAQLKITQSWINFNHKETSHHTHNHSNSVISGVIYISKDPPPIVFSNPFPARDLVPEIIKHTPSNGFTYSVNVKETMLLLFPSFLPHGVMLNENDTTRVSLAFNTFYTGTIGNIDNITKLELK